jgi:hypothetical protein
MWVDIMTPEVARRTPIEDIRPPKAKKVQLRVIIWNTEKVQPRDKFSTESDIFVSCRPTDKTIPMQATDVHYRCVRVVCLPFEFLMGG